MNRDIDNRDPKPNTSGNFPLAYLITFTTDGTWLHGHNRGSVDPFHNEYQTPRVAPNEKRVKREVRRASHTSVMLNDRMRVIVAETIAEVARHNNCTLYALNVRTSHIHMVIGGLQPPERIMNTMKSWSTRRLRESGMIEDDRRVWTRRGSTRYLWDERSAAAACQYVCEEQGGNLEGAMIDRD
jgi:REP element-mobilizing transposase RayT